MLIWRVLPKIKSYSKNIFIPQERRSNEGSYFWVYARGEERPESDIDVLVEFSETKGLLTMVRIERELSEFLGVKVDLLTEGSISPYLIEGIKKEAKVISA